MATVGTPFNDILFYPATGLFQVMRVTETKEGHIKLHIPNKSVCKVRGDGDPDLAYALIGNLNGYSALPNSLISSVSACDSARGTSPRESFSLWT